MRASAPTYSIVGFPTSIRRKSRARLWSMEGPGNHSKGSPVVSFLFLLEPKGDPAQRSAFGKEEGGCEYGAFAAPAEAEWSRLLLTLRRFFSFSEKRKKRMGAQKTQVGFRPPVNFSVICFASDTHYFPEISGWRSSPKKNTATVPGPQCEAMIVPISLTRMSPWMCGKCSATACRVASASAGQLE